MSKAAYGIIPAEPGWTFVSIHCWDEEKGEGLQVSLDYDPVLAWSIERTEEPLPEYRDRGVGHEVSAVMPFCSASLSDPPWGRMAENGGTTWALRSPSGKFLFPQSDANVISEAQAERVVAQLYASKREQDDLEAKYLLKTKAKEAANV